MGSRKLTVKSNAILNGLKQLSISLFSFLTYFYVVRTLGVEAVGGYSYVTSTIAYFILIAGLGISNYAAREGAIYRDDPEKISQLASQIFTINMLSTLVAYVAFGICMFIFPSFKEYKTALLIQSLIIVFTTLGVEWIYTIYEDFLFLTVRTVLVQVVSFVCVFLFVKSPDDFIIYILITVFSTCGGCALNLLLVRKHCRFGFTKDLDLLRHLKPIMILGASAIAVNIYLNSDATLLKELRGEYETGLYYNSAKIYAIVKSVLNAFILVSIPSLSKLVAEKKIEEYNNNLRTVLKTLLLLIIPAITGMVCLNSEIVVMVGGKDCYESRYSFVILSFALLFAVFACFITHLVLIIHKKEKYFMYGTIISAVMNIALNFIFIPLWGDKGAAFTTILAEFFICAFSLWKSKDDCDLSGIYSTIWKSVLSASLIVVTCLVTKMFISNIVLIALVAVPISVICYLAMMMLLKEPIILNEAKKLVSKFRK